MARGEQWVRNHAFMLSTWAGKLDNKTLTMASGLNTIMSGGGDAIDRASQYGLPYHYINNTTELSVLKRQSEYILGLYAGNTGWYIKDEPRRSELPSVATVASWLKERTPHSLVYCGVGYVADQLYTYDQYLHDLLSAVRPDVLITQNYPFDIPDPFVSDYFAMLMLHRRFSTQYRVPNFKWIHARNVMPGDSKIRWAVYTALTSGCKGLSYFRYEEVDGGGDDHYFMLEHSGHPSTRSLLYDHLASLNRDVASQGQALRFLTSTAVFYMLGPGSLGPPSGVGLFSPSEVPAARIAGWDIVGRTDGNARGRQDGLIGFFIDENGEVYFMLTNMNIGTGYSANDAVHFQIWFDRNVTELHRLNRTSGMVEQLLLRRDAVHGPILEVTLPGGTGDLFKIGPNPWFPGVAPRPPI